MDLVTPPFHFFRFRRCLDLYLCPRVEKARLNVPPSAILPPLPNPKVKKIFMKYTFETLANYWTAGVKAISNDGAVTNDRTSGTHMRWHCIPSLDSFVSRNANFTFP